ncbi:glycoside hydrolase family 13 protein [Microbacterium sp.]|uniref:glycoside hydrolase family 13 protein n=1 Tax=Microbacterium sp. TaxID=51671 RepID=UPI002E30D78A|nr:glycoside hydrolase family 13 protein [Microbacterium sp.]HEX5729776.1 glycoside hydrolase family 13 protein [Microbacterium sp.]
MFLRVPKASSVTRVMLRTYIDGEQALSETTVDRETEEDVRLRAQFRVENPVVNYRWLLDGVPNGYQWLNGEGFFDRDVTDASDFRISTYPAPPAWAADAVLYQIFPDRFAKSLDRPAPDWAIPQRWDDAVIGSGPETPFQYFGGDLDGITAHLDHIASTGANTLYLTPIFPARSNHRYDASTFDEVDPLLGGNEALERLSDAVHARGMRIMGDLTTNHSGAAHEWFQRAIADADSSEAGYFTFTDHPDEYVSWFGHRSLPKFDHRSQALRRALYEGPDSTVAKWVGPHGLDGWRIDVANMTARLGAIDLNHMVATTLRATMAEANPQSLLLAEHSNDASHDLLGDGWHGIMDYAGFSRPLWAWLKRPEAVRFEPGPVTPVPRFGGHSMVATMRAFNAAIPWRVRAHALTLVGSHDVARIATFLDGDGGLITVAFGMMASMPGIPMLWAGDEIGQEGVNGEDGRRPFPWHDTSGWDMERLAVTRSLFNARAASVALRHGGLRWLAVSDDAVTFVRESPVESVLVHAARAAHSPVRLGRAVVGPELTGLAGATDIHADRDGVVTLPANGPAFGMWRIR